MKNFMILGLVVLGLVFSSGEEGDLDGIGTDGNGVHDNDWVAANDPDDPGVRDQFAVVKDRNTGVTDTDLETDIGHDEVDTYASETSNNPDDAGAWETEGGADFAIACRPACSKAGEGDMFANILDEWSGNEDSSDFAVNQPDDPGLREQFAVVKDRNTGAGETEGGGISESNGIRTSTDFAGMTGGESPYDMDAGV